MKKLSIATAGAALLVLGTVGTAQADIVEFNLSGTLSSGFYDPFNRLGSVRAGDVFTGNFSIDDQFTNDLAGAPCPGPVENCGRYAAAITNFNFQVGDFAFRLSDLSSTQAREVVLLDNTLPPYPQQDIFYIVINERPGLSAQYIRVSGTDPSANALNSGALVGFNPGLFTNQPANVAFSYVDSTPGNNPLYFGVDNIRIEAVPEPSGGTELFALGALGAIIFGQRVRTRIARSNRNKGATNASRSSL